MGSTVTELLRRRFGGKKEVDPYADWMEFRFNGVHQITPLRDFTSYFTRWIVNGEEVDSIKNWYDEEVFDVYALPVGTLPPYFFYTGNNLPYYVRIPKTIVNIQGGACLTNNNIGVIVSDNPIPCPNSKWNFYTESQILYVPDESITLYQNADGWKNFTTIKGMSELQTNNI